MSTSTPWTYGKPSQSLTSPKTFDEFKSAIFKLYPGLESKRKWTIVDIDKLVGEQLRMGILDVSDLGNYY
jgi:hypothetical protein